MGRPPTKQHPTHAYARAGSFTVELAASNAGGTSRASRALTVREPEAPRTVAVVAHVAGVGGTPWRSDVALANPSDAVLPLQLVFTATGSWHLPDPRRDPAAAREPPAPRPRGDALSGRGQAGWAAPGAARRRPSARPCWHAPTRWRRTATLGRECPPWWRRRPERPTCRASSRIASYRTNVGVTADALGVWATIRLYRGTDGQVGTLVRKGISPRDQQQWALDTLFPGQAQAGVPMTVGLALDQAGVPYASLVDQASRDSVFLVGAVPASEWLVPVVAHNPGQAGTYWRSDLGVFNPSPTAVTVTLEYLPQGLDNSQGGLVANPVMLAGQATQVMGDVAGSLFGVTNGKGALLVRSTGPVVVSSRTYTNREGGGTYGHGGPPVQPQALVATPRTIAGVRQADGYRSNVGLVTGSRGVLVTLRLRDADGAVLATRSNFYVPPRSLVQLGLTTLFPGAPLPDPVGAIDVLPDGPLLAYLSVVDGSSQDPVLVLAP